MVMPPNSPDTSAMLQSPVMTLPARQVLRSRVNSAKLSHAQS
jgi:hypothetical protein